MSLENTADSAPATKITTASIATGPMRIAAMRRVTAL